MLSGKPRTTTGKSKVRAPKKHSTEDHAATLKKLETAIEQIQNHDASKLSFEEHYRYAYNLVLHKNGHTLYNSVADLISKHLEQQTLQLIVPKFPPTTDQTQSAVASSSTSSNAAAASTAQVFLDAVRDVWEDHKACMSKLRDVFKYMDKVYTGSSQLPPIWELGLSLFFHRVILYTTEAAHSNATASSSAPASSSSARPSTSNRTPVRPRAITDPTTVAYQLIHTLLNAIRIERQGEVVSRHSIRNAVQMLSELTDEGAIPLPVVASNGTGSGTPVLSGSSSITGSGRGGPVLGDKDMPNGQSPYRTAVEQAFLARSAEFYREESTRLLVENDCPTFLKKISKRLEEERERAQTYLASSTEPLLIQLLEQTLITNHLVAILDHPASGLSTLLQDNRVDDLRMLYTLFARVSNGLATLRTSVSKWIIDIGKQVNDGLIVVAENDSKVEDEEMEDGGKGKGKAKETVSAGSAKTKSALGWVQNVLDLKDKFDGLLADAFSNDKVFERSINEAFSSFVNANESSPEYISLYIDQNLKKGLKGKTEVEVEDVLNKAIALFRYLADKDRFEKYYTKHLAARLIQSKSVSDDAERNMLAKIKIEAGIAFTKNAEGMMKDVKVSEDTLTEFRRFTGRQPEEPPFAVEPLICTGNLWPASTTACSLPQVMLDGIAYYGKFYNQKHSGRKLTFRSDVGSVDVKTKFKNRTHELNVSTFGMVILALFEGLPADEQISYSSISQSTSIPSEELKRQLQSLACAKYKILTKHPKGRDVNETDEFSFNEDFTSPLAKVKIQVVISKVETAEERRKTDDKVDESRNVECEACIVRIMKGRKQAQFSEVVSEVIKQLDHRFKPQPSMIKKAIERLISREYLERDASDRKLLRYLA